MVDQEKELNSVSGTEKKKRRPLSAETKYAIFLEAGRGDVPVAEVLRKHGIHSSELQRIREKVRLGAVKELGGKSRASCLPAGTAVNHANDEELRRLEAEKERMEKALLELTIEHQLLKKKDELRLQGPIGPQAHAAEVKFHLLTACLPAGRPSIKPYGRAARWRRAARYWGSNAVAITGGRRVVRWASCGSKTWRPGGRVCRRARVCIGS